MAYAPLPAYNGNALVNFQPINDAIDSNRANDLRQRQFALQQDSHDMQRQQFDRQEAEKAAAAQGWNALRDDPSFSNGLPSESRAVLNALTPEQGASFATQYVNTKLQQSSPAYAADLALKKAQAAHAYAQAEASKVQAGEQYAVNTATGDIYSKRTGSVLPQEGGGQVKLLADAVQSGNRPPALQNVPRGTAAAVGAELERRGVNITKMQLEFDAAHKQVQAVNGPQMTRYAGLSQSVVSTIDRVNELAQEMGNSGFTGLNQAKLAILVNTQGNTKAGQLATQYLAAVNTLKEEFANLAQGGYAPTEAAWHLANQQINGNYGVDQMQSTLKEVQRLVNYRLQAIPNFGSLGPNAQNRYTGNAGAPQQGHGAAPAPAPQAVPPQAIDMLRKNPNLAKAFDDKYGQGAAAKVLQGGQ